MRRRALIGSVPILVLIGAVYSRKLSSSKNDKEVTMDFEGYCVKCRTKRSIKDGKVVSTAKGRPMVKGACPHCGTTVSRFLSAKEAKK
jgi:hypothetical protein